MNYLHYLLIFSVCMSFVTFFFFTYKVNRKWEESFEAPGCLSGICCLMGIAFFLAGIIALTSALIDFLA